MMLFANRCDAVLYKTHRHDENISPGIPEPVVMLPEVTTLDRPNDLIITPSNRADIILGATTANYAGNFPARIDAAAPKKIATALGVFNQNVDAGMIEAKLAAASAGIVTLAMFEHRLFARATALGLDLRGAIIVDPDDKQQKLHLAKAYTSSAPTRGSASKLPMTLWAIQPSSRR